MYHVMIRQSQGPGSRGGKTLAYHRWAPGSVPGVGLWQGSGRPSLDGGLLWVLRFLPPLTTTERQQPRLLGRVYKFFELFVQLKWNK